MRIQIRASTDTEVDSHPQIEPQKIDFSLVKQPQLGGIILFSIETYLMIKIIEVL